jgi:uncharacterized protein YcfJ
MYAPIHEFERQMQAFQAAQAEELAAQQNPISTGRKIIGAGIGALGGALVGAEKGGEIGSKFISAPRDVPAGLAAQRAARAKEGMGMAMEQAKFMGEQSKAHTDRQKFESDHWKQGEDVRLSQEDNALAQRVETRVANTPSITKLDPGGQIATILPGQREPQISAVPGKPSAEATTTSVPYKATLKTGEENVQVYHMRNLDGTFGVYRYHGNGQREEVSETLQELFPLYGEGVMLAGDPADPRGRFVRRSAAPGMPGVDPTAIREANITTGGTETWPLDVRLGFNRALSTLDTPGKKQQLKLNLETLLGPHQGKPAGDPEAAKWAIKNGVLDAVRATEPGKQVIARREAMEKIQVMDSMLDQVPTGFISGTIEDIANRLVGQTTNPALRELGTKMKAFEVTYRRAITGAQFSSQEANDYKTLVMNMKSSVPLNKAIVSAMKSDLGISDSTFWGGEFGEQGWGDFETTGYRRAAPGQTGGSGMVTMTGIDPTTGRPATALIPADREKEAEAGGWRRQ